MTRVFNLRLLRTAACVLLASAGAMPLAYGASFHCPSNASASERIVCGDPILSAQDDRLATAYSQAYDATPDRRALEADRVHQWQWRQRNCTDKACVTSWYERRIAELEADRHQGQQEAAGRVKAAVADQHLTLDARDAVLRLKGIPSDDAKPAPEAAKDKPAQKSVRIGAITQDIRREAMKARAATAPSAIAATDATRNEHMQSSCTGECARRQVRIAF
jgi:uncharacterized protein